jgi:hypothetical protein
MNKEASPQDRIAGVSDAGRADSAAESNPKWWPLAIFTAALLVSAILTAWLVIAGHSPYPAVSHGSLSTGSRKTRGLLVLLQIGEAAVVNWGYLVSALLLPCALVLCAWVVAITFRSTGRRTPDWLNLGTPAVTGWWLGSVLVTLLVGFHASPAALAGTWTEIPDSTTATHNEEAFLPRDALGQMTFLQDGRLSISIRSATQGVGMDIHGRFSTEGRHLAFTAEGGTGIDGGPLRLDDLRLLNLEMTTPDEVLRLTATELVLKDLDDQSVTHWRRGKN